MVVEREGWKELEMRVVAGRRGVCERKREREKRCGRVGCWSSKRDRFGTCRKNVRVMGVERVEGA